MNKSSLVVLSLLFFIGCQPAPGTSGKKTVELDSQGDLNAVVAETSTVNDGQKNTEETHFKSFPVYKDVSSKNRFTPSGYMPDGQCITVNPAWTESCAQGETCIKTSFDLECARNNQRWGGIYWLNPADNWGQKKGGYNLVNAQRLVFMAKGDVGNERIEEFKVGGVGSTLDFPDSDQAAIGPVILTNEWRSYVIDLRGKDLSYIAGGFAWVTNVDANEGNEIIFYLDDIRYE